MVEKKQNSVLPATADNSGYAGAQQKKPAEPSIPTYTISEALEKGKITVEAEGAGLSKVSVTIKKTTQEKFKVLIPVGTYFVAKGNYQSMVSREKVIADLTVNEKVTVSVPASCANASKEVPGNGDKFDIALSPQAKDLRKLMEVIAKKNPGEVVTQVAVWIVTDNISRDKLDSRYRKFRGFAHVLDGGEPAASDKDVIEAMALVEEAGIDLKKKVIYKERISAIRGLSSENKTIQNLSLRFLNAEGKDRIEVLLEALKDKQWVVRRSAAEALGKLKDPRAVEPLIKALKDKDSGVRRSAAEALGKLKDPRAVEPLIGALKDEYPLVRWSVAEALGELRDPRAVEPLIKALKDKYWRESAAKALEKINPKWRETEEAKKWVPVFISDLKSKSLGIREAAVYALGELKDPRAVEPLIEALKDKDSGVRRSVAEALGKLKDPRAVEPLIGALKDEDWYGRESVAEALGELGDPRAVEPLIKALKDKDLTVRHYAAEALRKITGQHFGENAEKWQKWWEENKGRFIKG